MGAPKVSITVTNNNLGRVVNTADGVAGLVATGTAPSGLALGASKQGFSLADFEAVGITSSYDTTNTTNVWKNIKDFYSLAGTGKELWVMIVAKTTLMTTMCDTASTILKKLLNDAGGTIRLVGVTRVPDVSYTPTYAGQLDPDVAAAQAKLQQLYTEFAAEFKPFRAVIDGRDFQGTIGSLLDQRASATSCVGVVLSTDVSGSKNANVGLALGRLAANPVQRNIGRVKSGDLGIQAAFLTGQTTDTKTFTAATGGQIDSIHDKGYIFARKFQGKNGYYFNDDNTSAPLTDDYSQLARGRVIDKAITIAYQTYVDEILDDLELDQDGFMQPALAKSYQAKIKSAIDLAMTANGEISRCRVSMNAKQNVLSTDEVDVDLFIIPKGYGKEIKITLGFENPAA
jgi:hypothetical protein